jgi:peptide/nickel transport system substrate-binding protein
MIFRKKRRQAARLVALAAMLIAPALSLAQDLKVGLKSEPTSMDPQFHALTTNMQLSNHIFDALTRIDAEGRLLPALALSWKPVGERAWEFKLRPGVKFSDGTPFTADDVVFTFERAGKVPNSPASFGIITRRVERVEVLDPRTLRFHTAGVQPLLPTDLSNLMVISRKAASGPNPEGVSTAEFNQGKGLVGTGPFKFVSWSRGAEIVLQRNDGYWGDKPHWNKVVLRPISNSAARVSALLSGSVDLIEDPPTDDLVRLSQDPRLRISETTSVRLIWLGLNQFDDAVPGVGGTDGKNPFKDVRVRRALSLAIDRKALTERVMEDYGVPAADLMPPGTPGVRDDAVVVKYDPKQARRLLAEAGYPNGFSMVLGSTNGRYVNDLKVAQAVTTMWGRVGVKATLDALAPAVFFRLLTEKKTFSGFLGGWGDPEMVSRERAMLATPNAELGLGSANLAQYSNPEVDRLVDQASHTLDDGQRNALLRQASALALDQDVGLLPLYFERSSWGMRKGLAYAPRSDQKLLSQFVTPADAR